MHNERSSETEYRDDLADNLRGIPDRDERLAVLSEAKQTGEYRSAASRHSINRIWDRGERSLGDTVSEAQTLEELEGMIAKGAFNVQKGRSGMDHGEHLLKQIEMARKLGEPSLLLEAGGFRQKVEGFCGGNEHARERMTYRDFIAERFPDLSFSDEEFHRIEQKIPPGVFASIDTALERTVLLANALPEIRTAFSCSGHTEAEGGRLHGPGNVYLVLKYEKNDGAEAIMRDMNEQLVRPHGNYRVFMSSNPGTAYYFKRPPTEEWIAENKKRTPSELFEESKRRIAETLEAPELLDATEDDFFDKIVSAQNLYLSKHPKAAVIPYAPNKRVFATIEPMTPSALEAEEYRDFLFAPERWEEREELMSEIERDLQVVRQQEHDRSNERQIWKIRDSVNNSLGALPE